MNGANNAEEGDNELAVQSKKSKCLLEVDIESMMRIMDIRKEEEEEKKAKAIETA